MRGDGAAYHAAGIALGGSKFTVDANGNITKINNVTTSFPSSQGSANTVLTNNGSGTLTWSGSVASSGEYTPTETDITNVASSTSNLATYIRVGDYVHVSGSISITATSASTLTEIEITLPVASALSSSFELNGTAGTDTVFGYVYGNSTSDKAKIAFVSPATGSPGDVRYTFSYKITPP